MFSDVLAYAVVLLAERCQETERVHENACTIVRLLIERGADVNTFTFQNDHAPLTAAIQYWAPLSLIQCLINAGADVNRCDAAGVTPLTASTGPKAGQTPCRQDVVQLLLDIGANVNGGDKSKRVPLHNAAGCFSPSVLELLLSNGSDASASDKDGKQALHYVLARRNAWWSIENLMPDRISWWLSSEAIKCIRLLADAGASFIVTDSFGETPITLILRDAFFHVSTCSNDDRARITAVCRLLLERNILGDWPRDDCITVAHVAAKLNDVELLRSYASKGGDINANESIEGRPLWVALKDDCRIAVNELLRLGAHVDVYLRGASAYERIMRQEDAGELFLDFMK